MEPLTKRSMLNRSMAVKYTKQVQLLLQQTYDNSFVHPHPYNGIYRNDLCSLKPLDGLIFDPRFLFVLLLTSRWFLRSCMLRDDATSNNNSHLVLYGGAGTGKTLIASSIASVISTYKFITNSRFQNPDMLKSSLLSIEECDTSQLPSNQYKQLLDLKTHVKMDFKNLNPENVTEGVPCMITSNDDVITEMKLQKKYCVSSVSAALRRLYLIPMKSGSFEKMHTKGNTVCESLQRFESMFDCEQSKLQRIFNLIFGFSLYQQDATRIYLDPRVHGYMQKMARDFSHTVFGTFYLSQKPKVDDLISEVESAMIQPDIEDSSYLVKISTCIGQF